MFLVFKHFKTYTYSIYCDLFYELTVKLQKYYLQTIQIHGFILYIRKIIKTKSFMAQSLIVVAQLKHLLYQYKNTITIITLSQDHPLKLQTTMK